MRAPVVSGGRRTGVEYSSGTDGYRQVVLDALVDLELSDRLVSMFAFRILGIREDVLQAPHNVLGRPGP